MAKVWVKSLQCKSSALEDVYNPKPSPASCKKCILSLSCGNSSQPLRDVVFLLPKPQPETQPGSEDSSITKKTRPKSKKPKPKPATISSSPSPSPSTTGPTASIPTLTELPEGHSSRRIVEIIFGSSWSTSSSPASARFPGRIEMLFRVHNPPRTVSRFDEYRSAVRSLAASDSRCAVDGNEMMRFLCPRRPPGGDGIYDASVVRSAPGGGIRTFAGSGGAHESAAAGAGDGTRSMLVCRVITGRVRDGGSSEGESVSGTGKGEIVVFDERAVLPLFLIIYSTSSNKEKLLSRKHHDLANISSVRKDNTHFGRC